MVYIRFPLSVVFRCLRIFFVSLFVVFFACVVFLVDVICLFLVVFLRRVFVRPRLFVVLLLRCIFHRFLRFVFMIINCLISSVRMCVWF